jgi:hypothetical protein
VLARGGGSDEPVHGLSRTPGSAKFQPLDPSSSRTEESIDTEKKRLAEVEQTIKAMDEEDKRGKQIYIEVDEPHHEEEDPSDPDPDRSLEFGDLVIPQNLASREQKEDSDQSYSDEDFEIDEEID